MNFTINLDGVNVEIIKLEIEKNYSPIIYGFRSTQIRPVPTTSSIKMTGIISNNNYMQLDKWFNGILNNNYLNTATNYKKNIIFNSIQIMGIFPVEYSFLQSGIEVEFSVDYINGDLELFKIQKLRKEKLERLKQISCQ